MNLADQNRLQRIILALDAAIEIFQRSREKAGVGDIEAETSISALRAELNRCAAAEHRPRHWLER